MHFFMGGWMAPLNPVCRFDLILSNPPYIPTGNMGALHPEILEFEPGLALESGPDGGDAFRQILPAAYHHLANDGVLAMEMGFDQKFLMLDLAAQFAGYRSPVFVKDLAGHDRYTGAGDNNIVWKTDSKWGGGYDMEFIVTDSTSAGN